MFDPDGIKGTLVFRAMSLRSVYIIDTTESYIVVVAYLLVPKKCVVMQAIFKSILVKDSYNYKILI